MLDLLVKKLEAERLGSVFAVLTAIFFGIGVIAMSGENRGFHPTLVSSEIGFERPISTDGAGLMLSGYDPVAYFMQGRAERGAKHWVAHWDDISFRFSSEDNRDAFLTDPTRYLPQFGGHDAEGVRQGELRKADPTAFIIIDDKLYLLQNARIQAAWLEDRVLNAAVADQIWPRLLELIADENEIADLSSPDFLYATASTPDQDPTFLPHFSDTF